MNKTNRALLLSMAALLLSLPLSADAQWNKKPATEWTEKDAQKVLDDSPWAHTQVFTSPITLFRGPVTGRQTPGSTSTGEANATHVNFRIRFFSARPIRQAFGRLIEVKQKHQLADEMVAQLKNLTAGEFQEYIVVTVTCDSSEAGANVQVAQGLLYSRGTANLKNSTFLETKGGKRVFLQEYQRPRQDGIGARFVFPRMLDGKPFITPESEEIRFYTELDGNYRLDR
ncbi:MAG TPA: hypothetical protein VJZ91_06605, partial [Blastocatellia bacterium]|nr:hypothetical protein [Blastocatellia bacterium]